MARDLVIGPLGGLGGVEEALSIGRAVSGRFSDHNCAVLVMVSAWGSLSCSVVRNTACRGSRPGIGTPVSLESTGVFDVEESSVVG